MDLPDFELPTLSTVLHLAVWYLIIGVAIGFFGYTVAKIMLKHHPRRDTILKKGTFWKWILMNTVAWPGILVWLLMVGVMKVLVDHRGRRRN